MKNLSDAFLSSSLRATLSSNGIKVYVISRRESADLGKARTVFGFADRTQKNIFIIGEDVNDAGIDERCLHVLLWHEATHIIENTLDERRCDENAKYHVSESAYIRMVKKSNAFIERRRAELGITTSRSKKYEHRNSAI